MRILSYVLLAVTILAGCAQRSERISPFYVSTKAYQNYTCQQLVLEAQRVVANAQKYAVVQDRLAENDAILALSSAFIITLPTVFFLTGGNAATADQIAQLRGEIDAIEKVSITKDCPISFEG